MSFKVGQTVAVYLNNRFEDFGIVERIEGENYFVKYVDYHEGHLFSEDELQSEEDHETNLAEAAWESFYSDFHGGSGGMSDGQKFELSRDCGKKIY